MHSITFQKRSKWWIWRARSIRILLKEDSCFALNYWICKNNWYKVQQIDYELILRFKILILLSCKVTKANAIVATWGPLPLTITWHDTTWDTTQGPDYCYSNCITCARVSANLARVVCLVQIHKSKIGLIEVEYFVTRLTYDEFLFLKYASRPRDIHIWFMVEGHSDGWARVWRQVWGPFSICNIFLKNEEIYYILALTILWK